MALWNLYFSLVALTKNNPSNPRSSISPSPSPPSRLFCTTGTYKEALVRDRQTDRQTESTFLLLYHMEASYLGLKILSHTALNTHISWWVQSMEEKCEYWWCFNASAHLLFPLSRFRPQRSKEGSSWRVCVVCSRDRAKRIKEANMIGRIYVPPLRG